MTYANGKAEEGTWKDNKFLYATTATGKLSSVCSSDNVKVCSDDLVCVRGSRWINGQRIWDKRSNYIQFADEAKERGLSCNVKTTTQAALASGLPDDALCRLAVTTLNSGQKLWTSFTDIHVVKAKKRGLSCGVLASSISTSKAKPQSESQTIPIIKQTQLAVNLLKGYGVAVDKEKAFNLFLLSATKRDSRALHHPIYWPNVENMVSFAKQKIDLEFIGKYIRACI